MKIELKNKITLGLWLLFALTILVLFVAASNHKKNSFCTGTKLQISGNYQTYFVTEAEVAAIINANGTITEKLLKNIDISSLEIALQKNAWIKNAELFFDNNGILHIDVEQRQPIARLFTINGSSSYIDKDGLRLPIKNTATARVLTITGFTSDNDILTHIDSNLLMNIKSVANYIQTDSFWNAQIAQLDIITAEKFELIPTIGNHTIKIGDANNLKEKFSRLFTFYTKAWLQNGMDTYESIDVRFINQVIATRKGASINIVDSSRLVFNSIDSLNHFTIDSFGY